MQRHLAFLMCLASGVVGLSPASVSAKQASPVLPLTAKVEGRGYAEMSADWWKWAFAQVIPPYKDPDGRLCDLGQSGPVWFLAGTDGRFDASRECIVPNGKHIFLPVINSIHYSPRTRDKSRIPTCKELQDGAAVNNDKLVSAVVFIDDVQIEDVRTFRVRSNGCFQLFADDAEDPSDQKIMAASDGYWLLVAPMSAGRHSIRVGANYGSREEAFGHMIQNFEYEIWVGGEGREARVPSTPMDRRPAP
jgi:hypothetical protein